MFPYTINQFVPSLTRVMDWNCDVNVIEAAPSMVLLVGVIVTALADESIFLISYRLPSCTDDVGMSIAIVFDVQSHRIVLSVVTNDLVDAVTVSTSENIPPLT